MTQHTLPSPPPALALRPLTGIVGRGSEMGRLLGHLDAGRSVRLQAARGAGATALLRALCAEPPRPSTPDGTIALPVGLPMTDLVAVATSAARAVDGDALADSVANDGSVLADRRMLVLLDDRDATPDDIATLQRTFPSSLLVVTGNPDSAVTNLSPVALRGLSQHHAVGLVEAAMGRPLTLEEGRGARVVASVVGGVPGVLVQAAAAVRDGGLTFADVVDLLDDPPRPTALSVALQQALDDNLHVTLSHLRAFGDVPVSTPLAAVAAGLSVDEAQRRLRRLAVLGLVLSDGRDGWTAAAGVPSVSDPVRAAVARRVSAWLQASPADADVLDVGPVLALVADRVQVDDRDNVGSLTAAALALPVVADLDATRTLLAGAATWSQPPSGGPGVPTIDEPAAMASGALGDSHGGEDAASGGDAASSTGDSEDAERADANSAPVPVSAGTAPALDAAPRADAAIDKDAAPPVVPATSDDELQRNPVLAFASDRRRLAVVAVVSAAVIAAILLVVPSLRDDGQPATLRADVDLGVATVGESTSGTLTLDLTATDARAPVDLTVSGPDADAFAVDPTRCDTLDCRTAVTFSPDRSGTHLATVTAVDAEGTERGVASLTASGTGDAPDAPLATNLSVTLFPTEPSPIPAGGQATLPLSVTNGGPDDSSGAVLVVTVPPGVTAAADGCTFAGADLRCPIAELPAGQSDRLGVTLDVPADVESVRVSAQVDPVTDSDEATGDNAAGFTYPVAPPEESS